MTIEFSASKPLADCDAHPRVVSQRNSSSHKPAPVRNTEALSGVSCRRAHKPPAPGKCALRGYLSVALPAVPAINPPAMQRPHLLLTLDEKRVNIKPPELAKQLTAGESPITT